MQFAVRVVSRTHTHTSTHKQTDASVAPHSCFHWAAILFCSGDLKNAATIFERAVQQPFKFVDDLAQVYTAWAEMYVGLALF